MPNINPEDVPAALMIVVLISSGAVVFLGGTKLFLKHRKPWVLRSWRKPSPPRADHRKPPKEKN